MDKYNGLRNVAYVCKRLGLLGGVLWFLNSIYYLVEFFSGGLRLPNIRETIASYGGALFASLIAVLLLYAVGGVINLLLDIEANTRK